MPSKTFPKLWPWKSHGIYKSKRIYRQCAKRRNTKRIAEGNEDGQESDGTGNKHWDGYSKPVENIRMWTLTSTQSGATDMSHQAAYVSTIKLLFQNPFKTQRSGPYTRLIPEVGEWLRYDSMHFGLICIGRSWIRLESANRVKRLVRMLNK